MIEHCKQHGLLNEEYSYIDGLLKLGSEQREVREGLELRKIILRYKQGEYAKSRESCLDYLERYGENKEVIEMVIQNNLRLEDYRGVVEFAQRVIRLSEDQAEKMKYLSVIGDAQVRLQNPKDAAEVYRFITEKIQKSLELQKRVEGCHYLFLNYGQILFSLGHYDTSE